MISIVDKFLRKSFVLTKRLLMSSKTISNAIMDVYNANEFTDLYEHEKMLADAKRVNTYQKAIAKHVRTEDTLVDLGTGSGILSILASRNRPKKIYAIDHSDFIEVAREAARQNGAEEIEFVNVNSRSFNPPEKLDLILHEQIGDDLFDENMIDNILDLKDRLLKPGGRILPGRFELFLEPVALKQEYRVPMAWEMSPQGVDFRFLQGHPLAERYQSSGYRFRYIEPYSIDHLLCDPVPVISFDLNDPEPAIDFKIPAQNRIVTDPGVMDGICLWFRTIFDDEISFDTNPMNGKHSWSNRLFRTPALSYQRGERIRFEVEMPSPCIANTWLVKMDQIEPVSSEENLPLGVNGIESGFIPNPANRKPGLT